MRRRRTEEGHDDHPDRRRPIRIDPRDTVAILVDSGGLVKGTVVVDGPTLVDDEPQDHEVALVDMRAGDAVIRYGEVLGHAVLGHAVRDLPRGARGDEFSVEPPQAPALDALPLATRPAPPVEPLEGRTLQGHRNADGSVGTRNIRAVSESVRCGGSDAFSGVTAGQTRRWPSPPT